MHCEFCMRLCPCRFKLPLTDNEGQWVEPQIILDLHRELLAEFRGFTINPTSLGRWHSQPGHLYQEQVVVYEVALAEERVSILQDVVCRVGRRLGQLAMYFDAPAPSVQIIDLSLPSPSAPMSGGWTDEPGQKKTTHR